MICLLGLSRILGKFDNCMVSRECARVCLLLCVYASVLFDAHRPASPHPPPCWSTAPRQLPERPPTSAPPATAAPTVKCRVSEGLEEWLCPAAFWRLTAKLKARQMRQMGAGGGCLTRLTRQARVCQMLKCAYTARGPSEKRNSRGPPRLRPQPRAPPASEVPPL